MKKLITVLFAMMLMFSMTAFAEEADLTGEWYGTLMGISITMNFNEDGTDSICRRGRFDRRVVRNPDGHLHYHEFQ